MFAEVGLYFELGTESSGFIVCWMIDSTFFNHGRTNHESMMFKVDKTAHPVWGTVFVVEMYHV